VSSLRKVADQLPEIGVYWRDHLWNCIYGGCVCVCVETCTPE